KKIREAVRGRVEALPETYEYEANRLQGRFRADLCAFLRQLALTDPRWLHSSAQLVTAHRHELTFLRDLIDWRLEACDQKKDQWNGDDAFFWRFTLARQEVPDEVEEM